LAEHVACDQASLATKPVRIGNDVVTSGPLNKQENVR
jgi:hypothetical protein